MPVTHPVNFAYVNEMTKKYIKSYFYLLMGHVILYEISGRATVVNIFTYIVHYWLVRYKQMAILGGSRVRYCCTEFDIT